MVMGVRATGADALFAGTLGLRSTSLGSGKDPLQLVAWAAWSRRKPMPECRTPSRSSASSHIPQHKQATAAWVRAPQPGVHAIGHGARVAICEWERVSHGYAGAISDVLCIAALEVNRARSVQI